MTLSTLSLSMELVDPNINHSKNRKTAISYATEETEDRLRLKSGFYFHHYIALVDHMGII